MGGTLMPAMMSNHQKDQMEVIGHISRESPRCTILVTWSLFGPPCP